jgi:DNA (cytosine-5)-methyltransferase 1
MNRDVRHEKIDRLRGGHPLRAVDLFAGCGGLSLGFHAAQYEIMGAVELDKTAALTHARNFHPDQVELHGQARDMTRLEPEAFLHELYGEVEVSTLVDTIIGGPPCQAYARIGRAKLREVAAHPEAFKVDERGQLYLKYLKYVDTLQPLAVVLENVPDAVNYGGHNIANEICEALVERGYRCRYTLLNAVHYGVPQTRERLFLIGIAEELQLEPQFPEPTYAFTLPSGYLSARRVALKGLNLDSDPFYVPAPTSNVTLPDAITVGPALNDLPTKKGNAKRGVRQFTTLDRYRTDVGLSDYALLMRNWPGFKNAEPGVYDHVIRSLPRDYAIFAKMKEGDQYPEAIKIAKRLFQSEAEKEAALNNPERLADLERRMVPPYDPGKFPNKWRKLERDKPARTLMAHLGKDSYSHIHYEQPRTISVREAARLQSFPDRFKFAGAMNAAFRQIGNAVPPRLAWSIAENLKQAIIGSLGI